MKKTINKTFFVNSLILFLFNKKAKKYILISLLNMKNISYTLPIIF